MLDQPAPAAGQRGQLGLGVDGHREPDRLQHGQIGGAVGVGDRLAQVQAAGGRVVGQGLVAGLPGGGHRHQAAVVGAAVDAHLGRDDVVEQGPQRLHHQVEGAGDEQRAVAHPAVLADAPDARGEGLDHQQVAQHLAHVAVEAVGRRALEPPVEVAQEVAAVLAVQGQQPGDLPQGPGHEPGPLGRVQAPGGQPRVAGHHVGGDQGVLEVEHGQVALGVQHLAAEPGRAGLGAGAARRHLEPGPADHGREVDPAHVVGPVDHPGVEAEAGPVGGIGGAPHLHQPVQPEDGLALGVGAVELDVAVGPLELVALLLHPGPQLGLPAPQGQRRQHPVGGAEGPLGPLELGRHPPPARERPLRHPDGLVAVVVDGVVDEPAPHQVHELAVAERVDRAAGDLGDVGLAAGRAPGGHGQDGGHHQIDGNDVDDPLGHAGELLEHAPGVGGYDRLGHAEAPYPPRLGLGQGRLDDRGPHDADRHLAPGLGQGPLPQGLGEGVGVGEPEAGRPGPARLAQPPVHPALAQALDLGGQGRGAGRPQLPAGLPGQRGQALGGSAGLLGVGPGPAGAVGLAPPVGVDEERRPVHELLGGRPPSAAGHIAGGHGDEVGGGAGRPHGLGHPDRPQHVDLYGVVEGGVEGDGRGRVDDDVAVGQPGPPVVVEPEPVLGDVAGHGGDSAVRHLLEGLGPRLAGGLGPEAVEGVVAQHVAPDPLVGAAPARPHHQHQLAVGDAPQQPLHQRGAQEPGGAGDGDALAGQALDDHGAVSGVAPVAAVLLPARLSTITAHSLGWCR